MAATAIAAAALLATGYSAYSSEKARGEARDAAHEAGNKQLELENKAKAQQKEEEDKTTAINQRNLQRQMLRQAAVGKPRSTVLTSSLGDTTSPTTQNKTLLGM